MTSLVGALMKDLPQRGAGRIALARIIGQLAKDEPGWRLPPDMNDEAFLNVLIHQRVLQETRPPGQHALYDCPVPIPAQPRRPGTKTSSALRETGLAAAGFRPLRDGRRPVLRGLGRALERRDRKTTRRVKDPIGHPTPIDPGGAISATSGRLGALAKAAGRAL